MLTKDRRPALIALMAIISLLFPFLGAIDRHAAEAHVTAAPIGETPAAADTRGAKPARRPWEVPGKGAPDLPPSPCSGLPARRACLEPFVAALEAFAFPRGAFRTPVRPAEHGDETCLPPPELESPPAIAIVTLPDPLRSGLRYQYDRALEAVIQGIESRGYERDRYWLPWARPEEPKGEPAPAPEPDCSEDFPGLLLFRPPVPTAPPVAALIVGETPTWGMNRRALYTALNFASANRGGTSRILGPYFSGSSHSLRDTIASWYLEHGPDLAPMKFRLVSGTASHPSNATILESPVPPFIEFSATTLHDGILEREFYRYLERVVESTPSASHPEGRVLRGVALLSESGTAYGRSSDGGANVPEPEVTVRFPLHISSVRAEYQGRQNRDKPLNLSLPHTSLEPIFDEVERRDTPAVLSTETSVADDLVLSSELGALSQRGIRFIGIKATDAADILFLAHHIWEVVPDMRLFTFNHDLLFSHPELARELEGMLVVSPYSLFSPSQAWIHPYDDKTILGFSSSEAQGVYNASIAVFDGMPRMPPSRLVGYSRPFSAPSSEGGPSVWLSAVGMNGLWPLAFAGGSYGPSDHVYSQRPGPVDPGQSPIVRPARSWPFVALFLLGVSSWQFIAIAGVLFLRDPAAPTPRSLKAFRAFRLRGTWPLERHAWACFALGTLASICDMVGALALAGRVVPHAVWRGQAFVENVILAIAAANVVVAPVLVGKVLAHVSDTSPAGFSRFRRVACAALTFFVPIAVACVCGAYLQSGAGGTPNFTHQLAVFYVRATSFGSRLSPVVPLLLLFSALYVFCFVHLERLRLSDNPYFDMATTVVGQVLTPGAVRAASDANWRLKIADDEWTGGAWLAVALSVVVPYYALTVKPLSTLEGPAVDAIFMWFFIFVIVMIVVGAIRFLLVFRSMRALLRQVEEPRLLAALERIPKQVVGFGSPYRVQVDHLLRVRGELYQYEESFSRWKDTASESKSPAKLAESAPATIDHDRTLPSSSPTSSDDPRKSAEVIRARIEPLISTVVRVVKWARDEPAYALPRGGAVSPKGKFLPLDSKFRVAADATTWLESAEEFVASNVAIVVQCFGSQLRNLLELMVGGALIMALALSSYVFQPDRLLAAMAWATFVTVASMALYGFVELGRRPVLIRLLKSPLGRGGLHIVGDAFVWVFLPLGAFLAAQYPHTSNQLLSWLSPALAAFR